MSTSDLTTPHRKVVLGSDRSFGFVFSSFFILIAVLPLIHGAPMRWWSLIVATAFATIALIVPKLLHPLNCVWFALGVQIHLLVSPIIMALMFYGAILPMALLLRLLGKDLLRLKRDPNAVTYWILREPPGPAPNSMKKQF